ncbi:TPA: hypothetical protein ACPZOL_003600 [Yersinia enterocolitica]
MNTTKMREEEMQRLINELQRSREGFIQSRRKASKQATGKRMTERDRELMDAFRNR